LKQVFLQGYPTLSTKKNGINIKPNIFKLIPLLMEFKLKYISNSFVKLKEFILPTQNSLALNYENNGHVVPHAYHCT
jgi:hypothetical protein